jgi:hypothetical protein
MNIHIKPLSYCHCFWQVRKLGSERSEGSEKEMLRFAQHDKSIGI